MFEKLEVCQKAVDFADEVASLTEGFKSRPWPAAVIIIPIFRCNLFSAERIGPSLDNAYKRQ